MPSSTQNASPIAAKTAANTAKPAEDPKPAAAAKPARATSARAQSTPKTSSKTTQKTTQKTAAAAKSEPAPGAKATTTKSAKSEKPSKSDAAPAEKSNGHSITVTLPVTMEQVVSATVAVANWRTGAIRKVVSTKHGLPLYLGIGGLAVVGVAEWPVVAAAGVGVAVLRRWGPLRPESAPVPAAEEISIDDAPTDIPIDEDAAAPAPVA